MAYSKAGYTTLTSIISTFQICCQNHGQLKRKLLRPKNTRSTFMKFELSRLGSPTLKLNQIQHKNTFEQQWFNSTSCQTSAHVYKTTWKDLLSFLGDNRRFRFQRVDESREFCQRSSALLNLKSKQIRMFCVQITLLTQRTIALSLP